MVTTMSQGITKNLMDHFGTPEKVGVGMSYVDCGGSASKMTAQL